MKKHYLLLLLVHLSTMQIKGTISDEGNPLPFITIFKKIPIMEPLQTNKVQFNLNKN
jgi:hypothetical protein